MSDSFSFPAFIFFNVTGEQDLACLFTSIVSGSQRQKPSPLQLLWPWHQLGASPCYQCPNRQLSSEQPPRTSRCPWPVFPKEPPALFFPTKYYFSKWDPKSHYVYKKPRRHGFLRGQTQLRGELTLTWLEVVPRLRQYKHLWLFEYTVTWVKSCPRSDKNMILM
jgi:hypothetical protein